MAKYFFTFTTGQTLISDQDGHDLPNLEAVQREASQSARDLSQQTGRGVSFASHAPRIDVMDEVPAIGSDPADPYTNGHAT